MTYGNKCFSIARRLIGISYRFAAKVYQFRILRLNPAYTKTVFAAFFATWHAGLPVIKT
jgi:hypothetical protein